MAATCSASAAAIRQWHSASTTSSTAVVYDDEQTRGLEFLGSVPTVYCEQSLADVATVSNVQGVSRR
jgi:hypothetical protein